MASILGDMALNNSFSPGSQTSSQNITLTGNNQGTPHTQICLGVIFNTSATTKQQEENSGSTVSDSIEKYAQSFKLGILLVLFVIGLPANLTNMAVFCSQGLKDRVNLLLFSLSLTDALFLSSCFCLDAENIYLLLKGQAVKSHWNAYMVNNNFVCFFGTGFISIVLSSIIACERCYCVINPLKYQTLLRTRTMGFIILAVSFILFGLHFLVAYKYRVGCVSNPVTGAVMSVLIEGAFYQAHKDLVDGLEGFLFGLGISGGVMIIVITATIITIVKLRQMTTWRTETSSSLSSRDLALTKMLIGNSVFFIICTSPACFFRVVWFFLPEVGAGGEELSFYLTTLWILEGFLYINFTFNFFIYYVMGSRYRETFWGLLGKRGREKTSKN